MTAAEKMTAEDVARAGLDGVSRNRVYVLPMAEARRIWRLKRLMPETFLKRLWPAAEKQLRKKFEPTVAARDDAGRRWTSELLPSRCNGS